MSLKDALRLAPFTTKTPSGLDITVRRPNTLDLITAIEVSKKDADKFAAWLVFNHLQENGTNVFANLDEVLQCDVGLINEIASVVEKLYGEGKN
jgi:hypothetical protein